VCEKIYCPLQVCGGSLDSAFVYTDKKLRKKKNSAMGLLHLSGIRNRDGIIAY
jgi:hypothetical protein